jgi:RNA-directed DNA polymerase
LLLCPERDAFEQLLLCRHSNNGIDQPDFDLGDFFASVEASRVYGIFLGAGYPEEVAHRLTGLCTNALSRVAWQEHECTDPRLLAAWDRLGRRLAAPHLPQGAPTSPALANLSAYGLDRRLSALAASTGCVYSRYADDLTLSGGSWLISHQSDIRRLVARIVRDEGFRLNDRKSRLVTRAGRQVITGLVTAAGLTVERERERVIRRGSQASCWEWVAASFRSRRSLR